MKRAAFFLASLALTACPKKDETLTLGEAQAALEEASASSSADNLTAASVDISTSFTLGAAVEQAADEIRTFIQSQLPCAEISLEGHTLTVEYGVNPGSCTYRGHQFSGAHSITVTRNDGGQVIVDHEWTDFSNGIVEVDGTAHVTWDFEEESRRVEHVTNWTHLPSGRTGQGTGDRTQTLLDGGLAEGIRMDGSQSWTGQRGKWDLGIDGVEWRWADPVPQAGSFSLTTPADKTLSMSFSRIDNDSIEVTVSGTKKSFSFSVSKLGAVSET